MSSDANNHELLKTDYKESVRCHILKCFEISRVHKNHSPSQRSKIEITHMKRLRGKTVDRPGDKRSEKEARAGYCRFATGSMMGTRKSSASDIRLIRQIISAEESGQKLGIN